MIREKVKEWSRILGLTRKEKKQLWGISMLTIIVAVSVQIQDNQLFAGVLQRSTYGQGNKEITLEVEVLDETLTQEMHSFFLELGEEEYTTEELIQVFEASIENLDTLILGDNESADCVYYNLYFPDSIEGTSISISWSWNPYEVLNLSGEIQEEYVEEEGTYVKLEGVLTYGEEQAVYEKYICIYPAPKTELEAFLGLLEAEVTALEETTRAEEELLLPEEIGGYQVVWYLETSYRGYMVLLLGGCLICFLICHKREEKAAAERARTDELECDYFQVVQTLSLYIGAGMTVKNAWKRMVLGYQKKRQDQEVPKRCVYEEMIQAYYEMENGISELECYECFGRRCGIRCYRRLGLLLSQNVRKGTRGLKGLLEQEAFEASTLRKAKVRQEGERMGTKLLLPMLLMLMVVLVIVMVPAFVSIQI